MRQLDTFDDQQEEDLCKILATFAANGNTLNTLQQQSACTACTAKVSSAKCFLLYGIDIIIIKFNCIKFSSKQLFKTYMHAMYFYRQK